MIGISHLTRRGFLTSAGILRGMLATLPAWADGSIKLGLPDGLDERSLTTSFPQKGAMILQRSRPPLLETLFEVFDRGVFAGNRQLSRQSRELAARNPASCSSHETIRSI